MVVIDRLKTKINIIDWSIHNEDQYPIDQFTEKINSTCRVEQSTELNIWLNKYIKVLASGQTDIMIKSG